MSLTELRARLKALVGELDTLLAKTGVPEADQAAHLKAIDDKTTQIEAVSKDITTLERAEAARALAAAPAQQAVVDPSLPATVDTQKFTAAEKVGFLAVAVVKAKLDGGGTSPRAAYKQLEDAGFTSLAKELADGVAQRALNAGSQAAGGVFVPDDVSNEIIDILRPRTTFLLGGPRRMNLANGAIHIPAAASGATAYWRGEGKPIQPSQPAFRDINLSAKLLGALVPITDQLLRWSRIDIRDWVERDMAQAMAQELDRAAYFGAGTVYEPQGIAAITGIGAITAATGTAPTVAAIEANASTAELNMLLTNLPMDAAAWVMSPRTLLFLQNLRDGNGNRYFPELQAAQPRWRNKPVFITTNVAINGGTGTDETKILLVNFNDAYFAESRQLMFAVSNEASYVKNGATVSAFQNELTLVRATTEVDVGLRYLQAVQVINGVRWGAV